MRQTIYNHIPDLFGALLVWLTALGCYVGKTGFATGNAITTIVFLAVVVIWWVTE